MPSSLVCLENRNRFFVSNVSKDGVGGVTSCGQGSLWRVDALRGMAADGRQTVDHVSSPEIIGHDCGFRAEVLIEDTHTSLEFFKLQWRSAYVCEPGETLAVCVEQPNTVAWRVKQVWFLFDGAHRTRGCSCDGRPVCHSYRRSITWPRSILPRQECR